MNWTQEEAIELCKAVEAVCPPYGCHVALTGGLLYKDGLRKDCDILFYRIRQDTMNFDGLIKALAEIGFGDFKLYGFVTKARYKGKPVDILQPEIVQTGSYGEDDPQTEEQAIGIIGS